MSVKDKVVLVTGGASGIGRASAVLLGKNGARVVVADRDVAGAEATARQISSDERISRAYSLELADRASIKEMVEKALESFQCIDVLVHCAAVCPRQTIWEMSDDDWRNVLTINLDGSFYLARDVGRSMTANRAGTIIMITSDRGVYGTADYAHYAASKGGLIALTKSLAFAFGKDGVTVNGLSPGFTNTPMTAGAFTQEDWDKRHAFDPLGSHSEPEDIAETVLFLAGSGGRYMTGQIVTTRMRF